MYKILLCCTSGITTSRLVESIKKEGVSRGAKVLCWAVAESAVDLSWADADCVLVAPQAKGDLEKVKSMINGAIPCAAIDENAFSNMYGKAALDQAISLIDKN